MPRRPAVITQADRARLRRYIAAFERRLEQDRNRLEHLKQKAELAVIVDPDDVPPGIVTLRTEVSLRDRSTGHTFRFTVDLTPGSDVPSQPAPDQAAPEVLGMREGDEVELPSPAGVRRLRIERVLYQPEAVRRRIRTDARRQSKARGLRAASLKSRRAGSLATQ